MSERVFPKVRVMRNPVRGQRPWLVLCELCGGGGVGGFFAAMFGAGVKGSAETWRIAQDYAQRHALGHEATRCRTCLHIPERPLPEEAEAKR